MSEPNRGYSLTTLKQFDFPLLDEDIAKVEVSPSYERISCLATDGGLWTLDCPSGESKLQFTNVAEAKSIVCFDLHEGHQIACWRLSKFVKGEVADFIFTADLNKLYVSTGNKVFEIECQGESWYEFSCLLGGSRYRNFRRDQKVKTILDFNFTPTLGMYRDKKLICTGDKLVIFDRTPIDFDERIIFVSNTIRMEIRMPSFLQKDRFKVLHHGITVRSILQQVLEGKGSSTAEQICKLNGWTNISMDLTVLQQGITNEHNDMILFFFKTKLELSQSVIRSSVSHEKLRDEFSSWQAVIQEVEGKVQDGTRREFAERLTKTMVSSIAQLLHWISSVNTESPVQEEFVSYLCAKMNMFRSFLCQASISANDTADIVEQVFNSTWDFKSEEEVIHDAIQKGTLNEAQCYLRQRTDDKDLQEKATQIGQELVLDYLLRRETAEAHKLMESLGWNIDEKLKFFFLWAKRQDDRIILLENIIERPSFSEDLRSLLGKMEIYLRHFTCSGAKSVLDCSNRHEALSFTGSQLEESASNLIEHHMIMGTEKGGGNKYSGMILAWLMQWDNETFDNVILFSGTANEEMKTMDPTFVWRHLCKYAKMTEIDRIVSGIAENSGEVYSEDLPNLLEVSSDMLDDLEDDSILPDVAEEIRLRMARKNLLCDAIIEDFPRLLNTVTKIKVSVFDMFDMGVFLDEPDYVHRMIHFCLANDYLHFLRVFLTRVSISASCSQCMTPLLNAILKYNEWQKRPETIMDVTLAFAKATYGVSTVDQLWTSGRLKLAAIVSTITAQWSAPNDLEQKLPLSLTGHVQEKSGVLRDDISMYQLLSKSTVFDMTKLFGFQQRNTLYAGEPRDLPHFTEPKLVAMNGLKEPLTYVYYLLKYRPGCALECFFKHYRSSAKVLRAAAKQVVRLALHMLTNEKFVACCVTFIEGIGQESSNLRLLVTVGRRLLPRHTKQDLVENLCHVHFAGVSSVGCPPNASHKKTSQVMLQDLDNLLRTNFAEDHDCVPLLKSNSIVLLQYDFCHVYQLEMPHTILELCAETDNWLAFIVWSQVLQTNRRRLMPVLKRFSNHIYREHLEKALSQVSSLKDITTKSSLTPVKRDLRASLYAKIGVIKHQQVVKNFSYSPPNAKKDSNSSDVDSFSLTSDESSMTINTLASVGSGSGRTYPANLIDLVVSSHHSAFPVNELLSAAVYHWNPAPALIATHYNENVEECFTVWLETTTIGSHTKNVAEKCLTTLLECVENALKLRCLPSLRLGFMLFLPESVVVPLMHYIHGFLIEKCYYSVDEHWKCFVDKFLKSNSELEYVRKILINAVLICDSVHEQRLLLSKFASVPVDTRPSFCFLAQILESVAKIDWRLPFDRLLLANSEEEIEIALQQEASRLIDQQHYELAIKFSQAANLSLDGVICELLNHQLEFKTSKCFGDTSAGTDRDSFLECDSNRIMEQVAECRNRNLLQRGLLASLKSSLVKSELNSEQTLDDAIRNESVKSSSTKTERRKVSALSAQKSLDLSELKEKSFWDRAHTLFRKYNISPATSFMFFKRKSEQVESDRDKFIAMKYALRWNDSEMHRTQCWQYLLKCVAGGDIDVLADVDFKAEELILYTVAELPQTRVLLESDSEKRALELLINHLLSQVSFREAQFVSETFSIVTDEYQLAVTCVQLAEGLVVPEAISPKFKDQIAEKNHPTQPAVRLSNSVNSMTCSTIEELTLIAEASRPVCRRVFLLHLLSTSLNLTYTTLAEETDPLQLLRRILNSSLTNKFQMAKELIAVYSIDDKVLSSFIYREIQKSLQFKEEFCDFDMVGNFEQVISLCKDATILGNRIFYGLKKDDDIRIEAEQRTAYAGSPLDNSFLYNDVELCILAHECFSVACCMEGISHVLRHCHVLVKWLIRYEQFAMMLRLLTGIGRYSEMSFVFDALEEHDQFEMLFQRGMEKVPHLKVALLDYLKKKQEPSHLDTMFKLNFTMHREIAEMLSESANDRIVEIATTEESVWPETADLRDIATTLELIIVDLADAAEAFVKADCLMHALDCTKRAELLSLQLYYIQTKSRTKVMNLNQDTFTNWINNHPIFCEALLVAEASHFNVLWYVPLFQNVIVNGDQVYLREFKLRMQLTAHIITKMADCYSRYQRPTQMMQMTFEKLLIDFPDLETRYFCAQKLGFKCAAKLRADKVLCDIVKISS